MTQVSVSQDRKYTTISIPTPLYREVSSVIEEKGFRSVTEYIIFVTRQSLAQAAARQAPTEDLAADHRR